MLTVEEPPVPSPTGEVKLSVNVSVPSTTLSSRIVTVKFFAAASPMPQLRDCETGVKSPASVVT